MNGIAAWNWHAGVIAAIGFLVLVGGAALIQHAVDRRRHNDRNRP